MFLGSGDQGVDHLGFFEGPKHGTDGGFIPGFRNPSPLPSLTNVVLRPFDLSSWLGTALTAWTGQPEGRHLGSLILLFPLQMSQPVLFGHLGENDTW